LQFNDISKDNNSCKIIRGDSVSKPGPLAEEGMFFEGRNWHT